VLVGSVVIYDALDSLAAEGGKDPDMTSSSRLASTKNGLELGAANLCSRELDFDDDLTEMTPGFHMM
jgi:hypothetical protein